MRSAEDLST